MLTATTEEDWTIVLRVFAASQSRRGDKGRNDRKFLEALHYFVTLRKFQIGSAARTASTRCSSARISPEEPAK